MLETVGVGLLIGIAASWGAFAVLVWVGARRQQITVTAALLVLPDTVRLLRRLAGDRTLPNTIRWRLAFALIYCGQPFNLIPDFIPVIGYADNVVVVAWALRSVIRLSGPQAIEHHWVGRFEGLNLLYKTLRIPPPTTSSGDLSLSAGPEAALMPPAATVRAR